MDVARTYGSYVGQALEKNPDRANALIRLGLHAESFRTGHFPDSQSPKAHQYLRHMAMKEVADVLGKPEQFAWTNIFAPVEILQCFDIKCISMECLASYLSGFWIEDRLIDACETAGFASTMCSYHKTFIGACEAGLVPKPLCGITTSTICDCNTNTFRYLRKHDALPTRLIDIPHEWSPEGEEYVVAQLRETISWLEGLSGRRFDEERLKQTLVRENESKAHYLSFLEKRRTHAYPEALIMRLFMLFATHLSIGSEWALEFFRMLDSEIDAQPLDTSKRLFWVHIVPYAQPTLNEYLNYNENLTVVADDFNLDFVEQLDVDRPLHALARKMICNIYNGDFSRKIDAVSCYVQHYECDGVVEFCHWGCKQSCGGVQLLKRQMSELGVPMLALDGDAIDRRSGQEGQVKTRFEAFLELLDATGEGQACA